MAEKRLSAEFRKFSSSTSSVKKGETLLDTARNIEAMKIDMVVIRHQSPGAPNFLAKNLQANIINAGDGAHEHPTQALLDMMTILEKFESPERIKGSDHRGYLTQPGGTIEYSRVIENGSQGHGVRTGNADSTGN